MFLQRCVRKIAARAAPMRRVRQVALPNTCAIVCRYLATKQPVDKWENNVTKPEPLPKPKHAKFSEDAELVHAPAPEMSDKPLTHQEIVDLLKDNEVIRTEKVYNLCWNINPHHFSSKDNSKTSETSEKRAYEGFAEAEASYTAEEWANAMVVFIEVIEQFATVLKPGMRVMDVGCGTGFVTAALAHLVGPTGLVIAIDNDKDVLVHAQKVMSKHYPDLLRRIQFVQRDGFLGDQNGAPFDAIYIGAAVRGGPARQWLDQLRNGGLIIGAFVEDVDGKETQILRMMKKIEGTTFEQVDMMDVEFDELIPTTDDDTYRMVPLDKKNNEQQEKGNQKKEPESDFVEVVETDPKSKPFQ